MDVISDVLLAFTTRSAGKLVSGKAGILLLCGDQIFAVQKHDDNPTKCLLFCRTSSVSRIAGHSTHHLSDLALTGKTPYIDWDVFLESKSAEARRGGLMLPVQTKLGGHGKHSGGESIFASDMTEPYLYVKASRIVQ